MDYKRFSATGKANPMSDESINARFMQHKRRLHYDKRHGAKSEALQKKISTMETVSAKK